MSSTPADQGRAAASVLVVDDKDMMRESVAATLRRGGFDVAAFPDAGGALERIARQRPDAVVTDLRMPGMTGIELVEKIRAIDDDLPVIVMTAFGTIETAVEAMKKGAFDYVTKPFEGDELIISLKRGLSHARLSKENAILRMDAARSSPAAASPARTGLARLIGESAAMRRVREQIAAVAGSGGTVLITGESGTGKEVAARALHDLSPRGAGPFLAVNCAALSESLLESELFGHERGAFTGAEKLRKGRFELADGGTLLLDEISEISPAVQAKLLRVLQERTFERVGSSLAMGVDVRVVATSNRDLPAEAARGAFRQDLYFRLNVLPVHMPALRERGEDVALLATHFVETICAREGRPVPEISQRAAATLGAYHWPGNVRELQNICERAVVLSAARAEGVISHDLIAPWLLDRAVLPAGTPVVGGAAAGPVGAAGGISAVARAVTAGPLGGNGLGGGVGAGLGNGHGHAHGAGYGPGNGHGAGPLLGDGHGLSGTVEAKPGDVRPLADIERDVILDTLRRNGGHRVRTAQALGIGVRTLGLKLKKWKDDRVIPETV